MAVKNRPGLTYFPLDVDFFNDIKIRHISHKFGPKGEALILRLFCEIYRNGYSLPWDEDTQVLFAQESGSHFTVALIGDVVKESLKRGLFNEAIFTQFGRLTSDAIIKRYLDVCAGAKRSRVEIDPRIVSKELLSDKIGYLSDRCPTIEVLSSDKWAILYRQKQQSKEKVKESKEKEKEKVVVVSSPNSENQVSDKTTDLSDRSDDNLTTTTFFKFSPFTFYDGYTSQELRENIADMFRAYCNKTPELAEVTRIFNLIENDQKRFRPASAYKVVLEIFEKNPLQPEAKKNTQYIAKAIEGRKNDLFDKFYADYKRRKEREERRGRGASNQEDAINEVLSMFSGPGENENGDSEREAS